MTKVIIIPKTRSMKKIIPFLILIFVCFQYAESQHVGPLLKIAQVWSDKPLARTGDTIKFSAFVENTGNQDVYGCSVELQTPGNVLPVDAAKESLSIPAGSFQRVNWNLKAGKWNPGQLELKVVLKSKEDSIFTEAIYKILIIARSAKYQRQELCTDARGYWQLLKKPTTLQQGNIRSLSPIEHLTSSQIKRNTYGINVHLPRSRDYEDPFNPSHLIDGDAESCWSGEVIRTQYPNILPWALIDLGKVRTVSQVNLVPYWHNREFPRGFSILISLDGQKWESVMRQTDYKFKQSGEKRGDKIVQTFIILQPVQARYIRVDFERLVLSGGNYGQFADSYHARLSGIEVIDNAGQNVALKDSGASIKTSDYYTGIQNTAKTVNESFSRLFDIGLKWVRVGQWGDQTEWAAIEREKGKYKMDSVTDKGIHKLLDNGVDILYGLNYGNALYNPEGTVPGEDIGPAYKEGHPFYLHLGPQTEEQRKAFVRYVDFVIHEYGYKKGYGIKWWELWNEEGGWFPPSNDPVLYGKLLYDVAKHIKEFSPDLKVMYGGLYGPDVNHTEIALREGAAPYLDAHAFHPYETEKPEAGMYTAKTGWNSLEDIIEGMQKPFALYGKPNIPVWENEWGTNLTGLDFCFDPHIGEYGSAKYLLRFFIYGGWLNVPTAWWGLYNLSMSQDWGIIDQHDYSFRPMAYALQNVCSVVSDVEPVRSLVFQYKGQASDPKVIAYKKDGSEKKLVLVWDAENYKEKGKGGFVWDEANNTDKIRSYPSTLSFKLNFRPRTVTLTDLYWGLSQPAKWSYKDGTLTVDGLIVRDYPVVITCI
jgi:hypothetical protein